jgi:AbrB family looped-hinge helix DNA binding protein
VDAFTEIAFSGVIDSRGRVTLPSDIRQRLEIGEGDRVTLKLNSLSIERKEVDSIEDAIEFLSESDGIKSFSYSGGTLEVVKYE